MRLRMYSVIGALWIGLLAGCGGGGGGNAAPASPSGGGGSTTTAPPDSGSGSGSGSESDAPAAATGTLKGTITTGSAKTAVAGVTVSTAGQSTVTDDLGHYSLTLDHPGNATVVLAKKDGYLSMSKQAPVQTGATTTQDITLYAEDVRTTFDATQGKIVVVNGAVIDIPADAIKDASGAPYNGTVTIAASYRNPTTTEGVDAFPQPYEGLQDSNTVTLQTVGVIEARLLDANGQPLQLRQNAKLTYPGVSAIDKGAASIPLWYYDETQAIWVREGQAQRLVDGSYQGTVAHFTQWNLDTAYGSGFSEASITACIQFQDGAAQRSGIVMTLSGPGVSHPVFYGASVQAGELQIVRVPVNTDLVLSILDLGNGLTTNVPVPAIPDGGSVTLPCQTLVGTDAYVPPPVPPAPIPVVANTPGSAFVGTYGVAFSGVAVTPATMTMDHGTFVMSVQSDGSITGLGSTARPEGGWNLSLSGQVIAGGYVTMTGTPIPQGTNSPPYASMIFTGQFPMTIPNSGPSGTWFYNGYIGGETSWTANTSFAPIPTSGCELDGLACT